MPDPSRSCSKIQIYLEDGFVREGHYYSEWLNSTGELNLIWAHLSTQGWVVAFPIVLALAGLVMVAVGGFSCELFVLEQYGGYIQDKFGYVGVEFLGGCLNYSGPSPPLQAGYAFAIVATVIGVATLVMAILTSFVRFQARYAFAIMSASAFAAAACGAVVCGVAFAVQECTLPDNRCRPGTMMYVAAVGTLSWIAAAISFLFVPGHERKLEEEAAAKSSVNAAKAEPATTGGGTAIQGVADMSLPTTFVDTVVNPDGTKTRTTTVVRYKGGQKVVETLTEPEPEP